ncbi:DUF4333 domain-containing protein [Pseudonocardia bannensis]|uniref:DUF4333 domain-containing protein n=1 Tax=Pseudonocardia bannensis TaxID=630973 RepID=A0A848DE10_9PSEU|nr:DUF4333 domain-containing protein [Pseudonocardia bannensis]NMH90822.1 DUF4333 domain-containing protein [Pseudonocardia bannensis]
MSTPQGPNPPHGNPSEQGATGPSGSVDRPTDQPTWGQQPPGGWGQPGADPAGQQSRDPQQTTVWGQPGWGDQQAATQQNWGQPAWGQQPQGWGQQPAAEQQWGQPGWGQGTQQAPAGGGKSPLPWIVLAAVVVVLGVVGVVGFWKPGYFVDRVFDQAALQSGVELILTRDYGHEVSGVSCAANIEVATGTTFTCDATVDGERLKVPVRVTSDGGDYEVGRV